MAKTAPAPNTREYITLIKEASHALCEQAQVQVETSRFLISETQALLLETQAILKRHRLWEER